MAGIKRSEEFYLADECDFLENCLKLLNIDYKKDDNVVSEKTGMKVIRVEFEATTEQYTAIIKMFSVR